MTFGCLAIVVFAVMLQIQAAINNEELSNRRISVIFCLRLELFKL